MPEPFKNWVGPEVIGDIADRLAKVAPFPVDAFCADAERGLNALELKARIVHLTECLRTHLDDDYPVALRHILAALPPPPEKDGVVSGGIAMWPMCQFVEMFGVDHPNVSVPALRELTQRFSCEFAIRPYLLADPDGMMAVLSTWSRDPDARVRRLVSEGTRPRLPWGIRLTPFVDDPTPVLDLLEGLKDDPEEFVRRSVANNLNDIAKDHPDVVVEVAGRWLDGASDERRALVRHALRTLFKAGHPGAMALFGFGPAKVSATLELKPTRVAVGESFVMELHLDCRSSQSLMIDYAVHHRKANGKLSPKVFKWITRDVDPGQRLELRRKHSMKVVTTRRYYPGLHRVEVQVNGKTVAGAEFELVD